jgi:hypothetical protein
MDSQTPSMPASTTISDKPIKTLESIPLLALSHPNAHELIEARRENIDPLQTRKTPGTSCALFNWPPALMMLK